MVILGHAIPLPRRHASNTQLRHYPKKLQNAVSQIPKKVTHQHFNSLQVTGIVAGHFLGVPYVTVSAHSRHIEQGCRLDGAESRQAPKWKQ